MLALENFVDFFFHRGRIGDILTRWFVGCLEVGRTGFHLCLQSSSLLQTANLRSGTHAWMLRKAQNHWSLFP